jgi:hypothetical protein
MAHDHVHVQHDHKADARAAFTGLILGAISLLILVYGIVKWTASRFEGHAPAPAASAPPAQH